MDKDELYNSKYNLKLFMLNFSSFTILNTHSTTFLRKILFLTIFNLRDF